MTPSMFNGPAPLPVTADGAVAHARYLRERYQFSYRDISKIMALYHDQWYVAETWRHRLRTAGVEPMRNLSGEPRGYARDKATD